MEILLNVTSRNWSQTLPSMDCSVPGENSAVGRCGWFQRGVCLALAEMLLDPLTVEAGEDGRWRHAPFPGDADAPAQNIDLPDRMGIRIDAHEASGRQRSSKAQCIFGS